MRINEVARKFHLENKQIIKYLESIGMSNKSHSSSVDDGALELLLQHFGKSESEKSKEDDDNDSANSKRFARIRRPKGWRPQRNEETPAKQDETAEVTATTEPPTPETSHPQAAGLAAPPPIEKTAPEEVKSVHQPPVTQAPPPEKSEEPVEDPKTQPASIEAKERPPVRESAATQEPIKKESKGKKKKQPKPVGKKQKLKTVVLDSKAHTSKEPEIIIEAPEIDINTIEDIDKKTPAVPGKDEKEVHAKHDQDEAIRREIQKLKMKQKRATEKPSAKEPQTPSKKASAPRRMPQPTTRGKGKKAWKREKRERLEHQIAAEEQKLMRDATVLKIHEATTVADVADGLGIPVNQLIAKLIELGVMASINQHLDKDTIQIIAEDFNFKIEEVDIFDNEIFSQVWEEDMDKTRMITRPPVVTIMGHVDHGKTKLLDAVRSSDIASGEAGGITQHIGAYYVTTPEGDIVFLDTPGHAAFTAMRARGAMVTDIVVLVVAATDGVMPQTAEAIHHAKAAGVPIIVAINKIDLDAANQDRTKQQLSDHGLVCEEWGGKTVMVPISAKQKIGVENLLESILLQAELLELKADPGCRARGTIVEGRLEQGRGAIATVLLQQGRLKVGDPFVTGVYSGRIRAMNNDKGESITEAYPSMPVEILGIENVPSAGDPFIVVTDDSQAKQISSKLQQIQRERDIRRRRHVTLEDLHLQIMEGAIKELQIIVKGDVQGSVGALSESLLKIESDKVRIDIIHSGVGAVTESDVMLASASNALIIGFNVRPYPHVSDLAKREHVDIRTYRVIYDAINDIRKAMTGMLDKTLIEKNLGMAEVREVFRLSKGISIAGLMVQQGQLIRNKPIRLLRDSVVIHEGRLSSLKRFKDDVKEVASGYECGIGIESFNDIRNGDLIECYEVSEVASTL
jgi:translation initiation factor IF-2